jgi:hypothetical protein
MSWIISQAPRSALAGKGAASMRKWRLLRPFALISESCLHDAGDLMILQFLNQGPPALDTRLVEEMGERPVHELDAHLVVHDGHALADFLKQGLEQPTQIFFLNQRLAAFLKADELRRELVCFEDLQPSRLGDALHAPPPFFLTAPRP